ncbi:hypothetical protein AXF42_Ash004839 [Apostasia shenzhenica]|uniref:Uncharacterized protein n=1 Tax=Apostasia shenzhenica TaxID=1088818 RepID=A0A2I0B7R8_9ASPA|nr:hypothetical protein AXF42_Ash004839 [Apostasia shenzhenica]
MRTPKLNAPIVAQDANETVTVKLFGLTPSSNIRSNKLKAFSLSPFRLKPPIIAVQVTTFLSGILSNSSTAEFRSPAFMNPSIMEFQDATFFSGISSNSLIALSMSFERQEAVMATFHRSILEERCHLQGEIE